MFSFVSQSLRDAPGSGSVSAVFPALAALAVFAVFATATLTAPSAEAAVSSDDISASVPLSADLESGESEEEFSSDIDVPDFYTGADGDVFALAEDVFGSPDREADPADAVGDLEPFPAEREALEKAQADPNRLNIMTLAMVRARMATMLLAKARAAGDLPPSQSGMDRALAFALAEKGIRTMEDLAEQAVDDIVEIEGLDEQRAAALIMEARKPWFAEQG